jgi:hypothetical protein
MKFGAAIFSAALSFSASVQACTVNPFPQSDFPNSYVEADTPNEGAEAAWYDGATTRYAHGVLGDAIEASILQVVTDPMGAACVGRINYEDTHVFEDTAPRLADMDGDGRNEVITIRSHKDKGAQIAVYKMETDYPFDVQLHTTTPYIGRSHRWLAPIGIADFNGDGDMDIAYVDRPHLAKILRVVSYRMGELVEVATAPSLSNHKIGWDFIAGGVLDCGQGLEIITADGEWQNIVATKFVDNALVSNKIGAYKGPKSLSAALQC